MVAIYKMVAWLVIDTVESSLRRNEVMHSQVALCRKRQSLMVQHLWASVITVCSMEMLALVRCQYHWQHSESSDCAISIPSSQPLRSCNQVRWCPFPCDNQVAAHLHLILVGCTRPSSERRWNGEDCDYAVYRSGQQWYQHIWEVCQVWSIAWNSATWVQACFSKGATRWDCLQNMTTFEEIGQSFSPHRQRSHTLVSRVRACNRSDSLRCNHRRSISLSWCERVALVEDTPKWS